MSLATISRALRVALGVLLLGSGLSTRAAAVRVANDSAVTVPTSAHYSGVVNIRPGNGEIVTNNPPVFSWFYVTNHLVGGEQNPNGFYPNVFTQTNAFQFQIATTPGFSAPLVVDVNTPVNFYNFLAPLNTNATRRFYWRVKYTSNGSTYFTNGPFTFTVAANAVDWDRSMLANPTYLRTNGNHPIFCFRAGEQAAIWAWMQTQNHELNVLWNRASLATNAAYFKNHAEWGTNATPNPTMASLVPNDAYTRANDLGAVLLLWAVSGDERWTNPSLTGWLVTNLSHVVEWYNHPSNNWAMVDYGMPAGSAQVLRLIAATYDWMYDYLGPDTVTFKGRLRTNAFLALERTVRFWSYNNFYSATPYPTGRLVNNWDWNYASSLQCVPADNWPKIGTSHKTMDTHIAMVAALVLQQDSPEGAFAFDWIMNYLIARTTPYAGFAAHHIGPYGYVDNHIYDRLLLSGLMAADVAYPQAQIYRSDFCRRFPEWYTRIVGPYRMRKYHGAYGDGAPLGYAGHFLGDKRRGWDLAAISRSGLAMQAYDLNREFSNSVSDINGAHWDHLPTRYHYRVTPTPQIHTTSALYPEDGYVIASSKSPSQFDCYTNGVGFSFQARPRGSGRGHDIFSDLSVDMWAYGTQLTDGGGMGLDDYGYTAGASPGLFVNGLGEGDYGFKAYLYSPNVPVYASIVNYTNSGTNFVYCAGDGTALFTNSYHPLSGIVKKVRRHILFVRSQYWVVYDEFASSQNCTFGFRWHIPWAFRYGAEGSALANETAFSGSRIGSNSLAMGLNGFTYVAGNYADSTVPNPPRIPIHVQFVNSAGSIGIFNAVGTNSLGTGRSGVIGTANTNSTLNPFQNKTFATVNPDRAVGMWVTNRTATTNWHFMTVIVPQRPGAAAPIIQRLDDNTVAVTYDGVTDTNTFNASYSGPYTFKVETAGTGGSAPPSPPTGVQVGN